MTNQQSRQGFGQAPGEPITPEEMQSMYKWVDELRRMTHIELMWIVALCIVRGKIREPQKLMNDVIKERIHQNYIKSRGKQ